MKISTKGRYALRTMIHLAVRGEGSVTTLREISESQAISVKYLEQLVPPLVAAGLLKGYRGARGGYRLNRPAAEITAGDVIRASEGDIAPVVCLEEGFGICPRRESCETIGFWEGLDAVIENYVDSVTLEDLARHSTAPTAAPAGAAAPVQAGC